MKSNLEILYKPFKSHNLHLKNRIIMAPMTRRKSKNHIPTDETIEYYTKRAQGNVGLIITEGLPINDSAHGYKNVPSFYTEESLIKWKSVVDSVHLVGGKIFPQLWHVGSVRKPNQPPVPSAPSLGPSSEVIHPYIVQQGETEDGKPSAPKEMSQKDIDQTIEGFAKAALNAKKIGFDGIEIHGAHSYLIDQFFWSFTNKRKDKYGGKNIYDRTKFAEELLQEIRQKVGNDFPIIFRFSFWKFGDFDAQEAKSPEELLKFLIPLIDSGVDVFHCSAHRFYKPIFPNSNLSLTGWVKELTNMPTIAVGSVGLDKPFPESFSGSHSNIAPIDDLLSRLEQEEFDLVAIGRALLSDPNWPLKVEANKFEEIVKFTNDLLPA